MKPTTLAALREQLIQLKKRHDGGQLDAAAYAAARAPLERQIADLMLADGEPAPAAARPGRALQIGVLAFVLVVGGAGYWRTGAPELVTDAERIQAAADAASAAAGGMPDMAQIAELTDKLALRLKEQPDDVTGWTMLGRSYMVLDRPGDAVAAFKEAMQRKADDAGLIADYADALGVVNGNTLEGEPLAQVERALKLDPNHLKALLLAGSAAYNRGDWPAAARYFDRIVEVGPAEHPFVQQARSAAADARQRGQLPPATSVAAAAPGADRPPAAGPAVSVKGTVRLAAPLQAQVSPDDTVFVFARPADGSRMPLAVLRRQVRDLPFEFTLDDSLAMSPALKISGAGQVIVAARVSKSGNPIAQPGDLEGVLAPVAVGASGLLVEIAQPAR